MAATLRPAMQVNQMPGPVPGPASSPLTGPRPGSTPPSPSAIRHLPPARPTSGIGFASALRTSSSLSRPSRPTVAVYPANHNDPSTIDRRLSLSTSAADSDRERDRPDRGSWTGPSSSASGSKPSSFVGTPYFSMAMSRRNSTRERERPPPQFQLPARSGSIAARGEPAARAEPKGAVSEDARSIMSDAEVTETMELRLQRDPETGKKMINQYLVMQEIGHGTHGRVRLGRDTSVDAASPEDIEADLATGSGAGPFYAIKIVERNPKKKRLAGLARGPGRTDGANRVAENEIRKEIAIFKKVHHPNVVRMKEIIDDPESSKLFMILEYCEGGEVQWKGVTGAPALTLNETRTIFRDTLLGLEYLHHQGIIHRDIKPSNLLRSGGRVKIADFGCSHYSEALFAATHQGAEGDGYVDDIELAKTAGSPAFFAPEMCYSDDTPEVDAVPEVPTLTLRPPSTLVEKQSLELPGSPHVELARTASPTSAAAIAPKPRHPITNAIDVWALGVTLYCLLFGRTPFDAANEYLLMQVIPTAQYSLPPTMSFDRLPTGANSPEEVKEALDLLSRLLEKDATKRISLEQAKRHPFTLRGMQDSQGWLVCTDPHAQTRVTVTSDEVTAAVTKSGLRERFKRHFKSFSTRLGFLGGRGRSQSNATADSDANDHSSTDTPSRSRTGSHTAEQAPSPAISGANLARRLSMMARDRSRGSSHGALGAESPRPGLLAAAMERTSSPMLSSAVSDEHLRPPSNANSAESTPRQLPSMASLDKIRGEASGSPGGRRTSVDTEHRPRSASNASSSGSIFSALGRGLFSRENSKRGSHRSNGHPIIKNRASFGSVDEPDHVFASSIDSHSPVFGSSVNDAPGAEFLLRRSMDDIGRHSVETFESGSPGSLNGHHHLYGAPSPDRLHTFESRFRGATDRGIVPRRGSTLSEDIRPVMEDEEVDWDGDLNDSDECGSDSEDEDDGLPPGHGITSAPADWNLAAALEEIERKQSKLSPANSPVRAHSLLKPTGGLDLNRLGSKGPVMSHTSLASQPSQQSILSHASQQSLQHSHPSSHSSSNTNMSTSLSTTGFRIPPSAYRAKSPLGEAPAYSYSASKSVPVSTGNTTPERFQDADEDDGLVLGPRRGRKGSSLSRQSSVMSRSPTGGRTPPP